jgi:hypothetical protein
VPDFINRRYRIMSREKATAKFREAGLPLPPELANTNPVSTRRDKAARLTDRHELILAVFKDHDPGPFRWRRIAELASLGADSSLRTDLSTLRRLGYLDNDGLGYTRTDKPYPMS